MKLSMIKAKDSQQAPEWFPRNFGIFRIKNCMSGITTINASAQNAAKKKNPGPPVPTMKIKTKIPKPNSGPMSP